MQKPKLLRITTVPISLHLLLRGQLRFMRESGFEVHTVSAPGDEVAEVLKEGVTHTVVPFTRKITPLKDFECLLQLIRIIHSIKPDIVHSHTPKAGLIGMLAAWWCNVPVRIHTVAGLPLMESKGLKRWMLEMTEWITYRCAHKVYPNGRVMFDFIIKKFKINDSKFRIIGNGSTNGIDTSFFRPGPEIKKQAELIRAKYNISDEDVVFSFVGRIVKDKGIGEIVKVFKKLCENMHDSGKSGEHEMRPLTNEIPGRKPSPGGRNPGKIHLILIGPFEQDLDPLEESDYAFLHEHPQVILPGFQADVRPWIVASDIFVFPSYREGFPNVVLQACCLEVPCIVSDINGCNEIIHHEKSGLIVKPKNAEALYDAMFFLLNNPGKRRTFALEARKYIVANFDQQYVWSELLKEYQNLLSSQIS